MTLCKFYQQGNCRNGSKTRPSRRDGLSSMHFFFCPCTTRKQKHPAPNEIIGLLPYLHDGTRLQPAQSKLAAFGEFSFSHYSCPQWLSALPLLTGYVFAQTIANLSTQTLGDNHIHKRNSLLQIGSLRYPVPHPPRPAWLDHAWEVRSIQSPSDPTP
jgi:hypothetical protein